VRVEPGPDGLPAAPADPGAAGLTDGRAVTLPPGEPDGELVAGAALQVDRAGKPVTLTVTSRRTVDAATAQRIATADPNRLVLLRTDGESSVLVVVAH
jgi:hypothetical protein